CLSFFALEDQVFLRVCICPPIPLIHGPLPQIPRLHGCIPAELQIKKIGKKHRKSKDAFA
ncbi:hypothetical protein, partial [Clostridium sp. MCC353]|uniref:hypothetical protein n=1 Tax=Clostridium sp. MCC353 TaxID=2592646 RepID=UPI001C0226CC